jgi:hypothetical protein
MPSWVNPVADTLATFGRDSRRGTGRATAPDHAGSERRVPRGDVNESGLFHPLPDVGRRRRIAGLGSRQHIAGKEYAEGQACPLLGDDEVLDDELARRVQRRRSLSDQIAIALRRVAVDDRRKKGEVEAGPRVVRVVVAVDKRHAASEPRTSGSALDGVIAPSRSSGAGPIPPAGGERYPAPLNSVTASSMATTFSTGVLA